MDWHSVTGKRIRLILQNTIISHYRPQIGEPHNSTVIEGDPRTVKVEIFLAFYFHYFYKSGINY